MTNEFYKISNDWYLIVINGRKEKYKIGILYNKRLFKAMEINWQGIALFAGISNGLCRRDLILYTAKTCKIISLEGQEKISKFIDILLGKNVIERCNGTDSVKSLNQIKINKVSPPLSRIMLEVTNRCNLQCIHCYLQWHNHNENSSSLTQREIINLIEQAEQIGVWEFELTGGEPFVCSDILFILDRLKNSYMLVNLYTNLAFENDRWLEAIVQLHPKAVITSIDGYNAETHDRFRGEQGAFAKTARNIKQLKEMGICVRVNVTVSKYNIQEIDKIVSWLKNELKTPYVLADIVGSDPKLKALNISPNKLSELIYKYSKETYLLRASRPYNEKKIAPPCGVGQSFLFISSNGNVGLCPTLTKWEDPSFLAGNIKKSPLQKIWEESPAFQKYRGVQCKYIENCPFRSFCKGGCRSRAFFVNGALDAPDDIICKVMSHFEENNNENKAYIGRNHPEV